MNDATRTELQAILGPDWRVVGGTTPPMQPPGWSMFLFDFKRALYIGIATGQPHRWVLWDGQGEWFGGGDDVIDVEAMAADLRAFVGVTNGRR